MNQKEYGQVREHMLLEQELEEKEEIVQAFKRVRRGENFSLHDLHIVERTLVDRSKSGYKEKVFNFDNIISVLEQEIEHTRGFVAGSRRKLRKRRLELDQLRRQRRLQQEKVKTEKTR